jgi:hypothetical protein
VLALEIVDKAEIAIVWKIKMKNLIKKWLGIDKLQAEKEALQIVRDKAVAETVLAQQAEEQAKMDPKARATARGEPYVAVLDTKVNPDNVRNGFFELDWNDEFVVQLKQAGYGFEGDPEEEIVDRWFRDLAANMLAEAGQDPNRSSAGFINVNRLGNGKAEVK